MTTQDSSDERIALLQGTLDLLILRTLIFGRQHGQGSLFLREGKAVDRFAFETFVRV
jgi:hypothetical protein